MNYEQEYKLNNNDNMKDINNQIIFGVISAVLFIIIIVLLIVTIWYFYKRYTSRKQHIAVPQHDEIDIDEKQEQLHEMETLRVTN